MKRFFIFLALVLILSFAGSILAQEPKKISVTEQEQQALIQAYTKRQQTQQKLEERKKFYEALLTLCQSDLKTAQADDENAVMTIRNIELTIGNAHNFNPDKYEKTDKDGKLVYVEKPEPKKENDTKKGQ